MRPEMALYRCYLLSQSDSIFDERTVEAETDADAHLRAETEIGLSATLPTVEIWQGERLVGRVTFKKPGHELSPER